MLSTIFSCCATLFLASIPACSEPEPVLRLVTSELDGEFDALWYDGQAELTGYRWRGTRYGQLRTGEAVAIFVTEPLGAKTHVKVDNPSKSTEQVVTVMKLNLVRDFQTGIYDYNTMTSVFADVADLQALKISFSSAEWCGHVYEELDAGPKELRLDERSYFQGESDELTLPMKPGALLGDQLLVWLRGLRGHVLAPGAARTMPYLPDAFERRLRHAKAAWGEITITREASSSDVTVPAGTMRAVTYRARATDGRQGVFQIEEAYPHRLLSWRWSRDEEVLDAGEMTGTKRMKYWELHDQGQETLRAELGL